MMEIFPASAALADIDISAIKRTPVVNVLMSQAETGHLQRREKWPFPFYKYDVSTVNMPDDVRTKLEDFYIAHATAGETFLFLDPDDNTFTGQNFGTGDGSRTTYQLKRVVTYGGKTRTRNALYIQAGSETIYIDGTPQNPADYSLNDDTGVIVFNIAPGNGLSLTADFTNYKKVIFSGELTLDKHSYVATTTGYVLQEIP